MKKIYIIPCLTETQITSEKMIANSGLNFPNTDSGSTGLNTEVGATGDAMVKSTSSYNVWDDDWSE